MEHPRTRKNLLFFVLIVVILAATFFSSGNSKLNLTSYEEEMRSQALVNELTNLPLFAKSVSVYDLTDNKKIYGKNDEAPLPLASLVKTLTVALAVKSADETISLSEEAIKQAGDYGFMPSEDWLSGDLAKLTLVGSANDGAYALAENDENFLEKMNEKAKRLGMQSTVLLNPTGLDLDPYTPGAYGSAYDANILAGYALKLKPEIFNETTLPELSARSLSGKEHSIKNTNIILDKIPNLLFSKTGYTELAGGNLTVIFKDKKGHDIAVTILGSTYDGRFTDMEQIVNVLYNS